MREQVLVEKDNSVLQYHTERDTLLLLLIEAGRVVHEPHDQVAVREVYESMVVVIDMTDGESVYRYC